MNRVGVLALQGGFLAHAKALHGLGAEVVEVRRTGTLDSLAGLVLPGGETTTLLNLMQDDTWFDELRRFHARGGALWGTCAGAILLSREVVDPVQSSLGLLDAVIARNAFGRQVDSFEAELELRGHDEPLRAVFIRAPRFRELGPEVEVLSRYEGEPVLVRQGSILACTFHPELTQDDRLHRLFLALAEQGEANAPAAPRKIMAR
jgi:5'-phosphate synthase pdxT subunit